MAEVVEDLVRRNRIEHVSPDVETAREEITAADAHLDSAGTLAATNARLAYTALYDAARMAISAHMRASGYRVGGVADAYVKTGEYASAALAHLEISEHLRRFRRMRVTRHNIEYAAHRVGEGEVRAALVHARAIVRAIATDL
jgi:hypothetical protein